MGIQPNLFRKSVLSGGKLYDPHNTCSRESCMHEEIYNINSLLLYANKLMDKAKSNAQVSGNRHTAYGIMAATKTLNLAKNQKILLEKKKLMI